VQKRHAIHESDKDLHIPPLAAEGCLHPPELGFDKVHKGGLLGRVMSPLSNSPSLLIELRALLHFGLYDPSPVTGLYSPV